MKKDRVSFYQRIAVGYITIVIIVGTWGLFFTPAPPWTKVLFVIFVIGVIGLGMGVLFKRDKQ